MAKEPKTTALDQIRELNQKIEAIKEQAHTEALAQAEEAVTILNSLGYHYRLTEGHPEPSTRPRQAKDGRQRAAPSGPCPICDFSTEPNHDGRKHRSQGERKRPFTVEELLQLGLKRTD